MGKKKNHGKRERPDLPFINLNTEADVDRFLKKCEGALPSDDRTATYSQAISSINNRRAAQKPRGERAIKATVRRLVDYLLNTHKKPDFESMLSALEDEQVSNKIFYNRHIPKPPLQVISVDRRKRIVRAQRSDDPNHTINMRFDTIQRYLRAIKREKNA